MATKREGLQLLFRTPAIIPGFSSVSSDRRPGGGPSSSRRCFAVGPAELFDLAACSSVFSSGWRDGRMEGGVSQR